MSKRHEIYNNIKYPNNSMQSRQVRNEEAVVIFHTYVEMTLFRAFQ